MGHWNYRVVKRIWNHKYLHEPMELFDSCEGYYDENGDIHGMSGGLITEDSLDDLRQTLQWMLESLDKPVIDEENNESNT